jgi:Putative zinc- or iron-chelating domain
VSRRTDAERHAKLDAIYARLPRVACRGLCGIACGPIPMSVVEADRLRRTAHKAPRTTPGQIGDRDAWRCIYLRSTERCEVYAVRPLICRVWGTVKRMSCPWGCTPDRWLSDHEFLAVAQEVERVGGGTVVTTPDGLEPIDVAFAAIDASNTPAEYAEAEAERVRVLRILHGGRIMGLHEGPPMDIDDAEAVEAQRARRERAAIARLLGEDA